MTRDDIFSGCPTNRGDRTKVLVAVEPRPDRSVIARAIQALRPHLEVAIVEPDELQAEVARLDPALVISSQPKPATSDGGSAWVEFRPYEEASAKVCIGGRFVRLYEPGLDDLISVVDEAERFGRKSAEGAVTSYLISYGSGGEDGG